MVFMFRLHSNANLDCFIMGYFHQEVVLFVDIVLFPAVAWPGIDTCRQKHDDDASFQT
jgi:hypothetical protein